MKPRSVLVEVLVDRRQVSAQYYLETGQLTIREGSVLIESIRAPDSWIALAAINTANAWGTQPTAVDLKAFLDRYVET